MIDFIILNVLYDAPFNMYTLKKIINEKYSFFTKVSMGTLHPALNMLNVNGYISIEKSITEGGQRKSKYSITPEGKDYFHQLMAESLPEHPSRAELIINIKLVSLYREDDKTKISLIQEIIRYYELAKINTERLLKNKQADNICYESLIVSHVRCYDERIRILGNLINKIKI